MAEDNEKPVETAEEVTQRPERRQGKPVEVCGVTWTDDAPGGFPVGHG